MRLKSLFGSEATEDEHSEQSDAVTEERSVESSEADESGGPALARKALLVGAGIAALAYLTSRSAGSGASVPSTDEMRETAEAMGKDSDGAESEEEEIEVETEIEIETGEGVEVEVEAETELEREGENELEVESEVEVEARRTDDEDEADDGEDDEEADGTGGDEADGEIGDEADDESEEDDG